MWTLVHMGVLHASQHRPDEARRPIERSLALAEAKPDAERRLDGPRAARASSSWTRQTCEAALASAARAVELAAPIEHFDTVVYAQVVTGRVHQKAGRVAEARAAYEEAVAALAKVPIGPAAETFFDNRRAPYLALVDLLARPGQRGRGVPLVGTRPPAGAGRHAGRRRRVVVSRA